MGLLLVLFFIVVPIAELFVIIQVGEWIGVWPTLLLLLLDAIVGSWLLKHQGRAAWRRFNQALAERRMPAKEVADGFLVILGGALLIAPGFLSDIVGILLLVPATRAVARRVLYRFTVGRVAVVGFPGAGGASWGGFGGGPRGGAGPSGPPKRSYDYDADAEEVPAEPDFDHRLPPAED
ncbi:MAG TPA: FxsA family protein [Solirubrobacterales bacterium]|nr:FxsA family protein [Solirubrobacterales bacterium]